MPPPLTSPVLNVADAVEWAAIEVAFAAVPKLVLQQAWRPEPEVEFNSGRVRVGASVDGLLIYAVLEDWDIFNDVRAFNALSFLHGDVFEIFVRPDGQEAYLEFHISPHNQKLQLRWPSSAVFREFQRTTDQHLRGIEKFLVWQPELWSRTSIEEGRWRVLARIPFQWVAGVGGCSSLGQLHVSFSRYDYSRHRSSPVLSSTSPHPKCDFHRQEEWDRLVMESQPSSNAADCFMRWMSQPPA